LSLGREAAVVALIVWAATVAAVDWRQRRVPNALLLVVLLPAGVFLAWFGAGILGASPGSSFSGALAGGLILLPGYLWFGLGAGDVKLAAILGFLVGWSGLWWVLLLAALILGLMSMLTLVCLGSSRASLVRLPAAVALGGGFLLVLLLMSWGNR